MDLVAGQALVVAVEPLGQVLGPTCGLVRAGEAGQLCRVPGPVARDCSVPAEDPRVQVARAVHGPAVAVLGQRQVGDRGVPAGRLHSVSPCRTIYSSVTRASGSHPTVNWSAYGIRPFQTCQWPPSREPIEDRPLQRRVARQRRQVHLAAPGEGEEHGVLVPASGSTAQRPAALEQRHVGGPPAAPRPAAGRAASCGSGRRSHRARRSARRRRPAPPRTTRRPGRGQTRPERGMWVESTQVRRLGTGVQRSRCRLNCSRPSQ